MKILTKGRLDFCKNSYFMIYFASLILCGVFFLLKSDILVLREIAINTSKFCLDNVPNQSSYVHFHQALLCGASFKNDPVSSLFQQTNLIHHLVVSGSHALLAWSLLKVFARFWPTLTMTVYFIFVFILLALTGFQPPLLRFLFFFLCRRLFFFQENSTYLTEFFLTLSLLTCFPSWTGSYSFFLSSIAALGLQIAQHPLLDGKLVWKQSLFFLILYYPLQYLGGSHPVGIVFNLIASPVFAVLLPLEYLSMLFPSWIDYLDKFLDIFFMVLKKFCENQHQTSNQTQRLPSSLWVYWCLILCFGHFSLMIYRRKNIQFQKKKFR